MAFDFNTPTSVSSPSMTQQFTPRQVVGTGQLSNMSSPGADWNTQWNQVWNEYYNKGYNKEFGNVSFAGSGPFASAQSQGYMRGLQDSGVLGASTTNRKQSFTPTQSSQSPQPPQPPQPSGSEYQPPSIDPILEEINRMYDPIMSHLSSAESRLRGELPGALSRIEDQFGTAKQTLDTGKTQTSRQIGESEEQARARTQAAQDAARRLFQELNIGAQQRFGGSSSAGEAWSELANREMMRNMGDINMQANETFRTIARQKVELEENYNNALMQLEQQKRDAIANVEKEFNDRIQDINRMRAESESAKSQMRVEALRDYRNQIMQIQLDELNYRRQIDAQAKSAQLQLDTALAGFQQAGGMAETATSNLMAGTTMNPQTGLVPQFSNTVTSQMIGQMTGRDDELFPQGQILRQAIDPWANLNVAR